MNFFSAKSSNSLTKNEKRVPSPGSLNHRRVPSSSNGSTSNNQINNTINSSTNKDTSDTMRRSKSSNLLKKQEQQQHDQKPVTPHGVGGTRQSQESVLNRLNKILQTQSNQQSQSRQQQQTSLQAPPLLHKRTQSSTLMSNSFTKDFNKSGGQSSIQQSSKHPAIFGTSPSTNIHNMSSSSPLQLQQQSLQSQYLSQTNLTQTRQSLTNQFDKLAPKSRTKPQSMMQFEGQALQPTQQHLQFAQSPQLHGQAPRFSTNSVRNNTKGYMNIQSRIEIQNDRLPKLEQSLDSTGILSNQPPSASSSSSSSAAATSAGLVSHIPPSGTNKITSKDLLKAKLSHDLFQNSSSTIDVAHQKRITSQISQKQQNSALSQSTDFTNSRNMPIRVTHSRNGSLDKFNQQQQQSTQPKINQNSFNAVRNQSEKELPSSSSSTKFENSNTRLSFSRQQNNSTQSEESNQNGVSKKLINDNPNQKGISSHSNSSHSKNEESSGIVGKYAVRSRAGALPGKPMKTNQDSYIIHRNFCNNRSKFFFSVCDGHGVNGHFASQLVKKILPGFMRTASNLIDSGIDITFSGSTCVSVYVTPQNLWCANIGDSRAIVGRQNGTSGRWSNQPLSIDHKPDSKGEYERIIASGGRVSAYKDNHGNDIGPARVWMRQENIPGLAMARSFGDYVASQVGVIPEPEVLRFEVNPSDKFIAIASDGVWEFLSNEDVVDMVAPFVAKNDPDGACEKVIKEATAAWKREDDIIDDITIIIILLNP